MTISNFAAFSKITNKAWYFMRIVCCQTIHMKYHTLLLSKIRKNVAKFVICCSHDWRLMLCAWARHFIRSTQEEKHDWKLLTGSININKHQGPRFPKIVNCKQSIKFKYPVCFFRSICTYYVDYGISRNLFLMNIHTWLHPLWIIIQTNFHIGA